MDDGGGEGFEITERFPLNCALWGTALLAAGVFVTVVARKEGEGRAVAVALAMSFGGVMLIVWEFVRRSRRATLRVRGDEIEVFRRGRRVYSVTRAAIDPWPKTKRLSDIVRGGIGVFLLFLVGGLITAVEKKGFYAGVPIIALGLGQWACIVYVLRWHWTIDLWIAKDYSVWNPFLMMTFRREDVQRLLDGREMPWA